MIFLDANAVVKGYVYEQGSASMRATLARLRGKLVVSPLVVVEVLSTFAKQRRARMIPREAYLSARAKFLQEYPGLFSIIPLSEAVLESARRMVHQHQMIGAGAMDVLHVASALEVQARFRGAVQLVMASSDRGLLALARAAGLGTFDPENEPLGALLSKVGS